MLPRSVAPSREREASMAAGTSIENGEGGEREESKEPTSHPTRFLRNASIREYLEGFPRDQWAEVLEQTIMYGIRALFSAYPPGTIFSLSDLENIVEDSRRDLASLSPLRRPRPPREPPLSPAYGYKATAAASAMTKSQRKPRSDALYHYPFVDDQGTVNQILQDGQQWTFFDLEVREQVRQAKKVYHQMKGGVCGIKVPDLAYALRCVGIDLSDHHVQSIFPHLYEKPSVEEGGNLPAEILISYPQWIDILDTLVNVLGPHHSRRKKQQQQAKKATIKTYPALTNQNADRAPSPLRRRYYDLPPRRTLRVSEKYIQTEGDGEEEEEEEEEGMYYEHEQEEEEAAPATEYHHRLTGGGASTGGRLEASYSPPTTRIAHKQTKEVNRPCRRTSPRRPNSAPSRATKSTFAAAARVKGRKDEAVKPSPSYGFGEVMLGNRKMPKPSSSSVARNPAEVSRLSGWIRQQQRLQRRRRELKEQGRSFEGTGHQVPAYLRNVRSKIKLQVDARRDFQRKERDAKEEALLEVLAKSRLAKDDPEYESYEEALADRMRRRNNPRTKLMKEALRSGGETAREIAEAFLTSPLMGQINDRNDRADEASQVPEPPTSPFSSYGQRFLDSEDEEEEVKEEEMIVLHRKATAAASGTTGRKIKKSVAAASTSSPSRSELATLAQRRRDYSQWIGDFGPAHTKTMTHRGGGGEEEEIEIDDDARVSKPTTTKDLGAVDRSIKIENMNAYIDKVLEEGTTNFGATYHEYLQKSRGDLGGTRAAGGGYPYGTRLRTEATSDDEDDDDIDVRHLGGLGGAANSSTGAARSSSSGGNDLSDHITATSTTSSSLYRRGGAKGEGKDDSYLENLSNTSDL